MQYNRVITYVLKRIGPSTEYGLLAVKPAGDLSAAPSGSTEHSELQICSLVIVIPRDLKPPYSSEIPGNGVSLLISCISDLSLLHQCKNGDKPIFYSSCDKHKQIRIMIVNHNACIATYL